MRRTPANNVGYVKINYIFADYVTMVGTLESANP